MGSMDGVALAKAVRKAGGAMQIVFVTGYSDYIAEGYDVEALNYLMKPVDAAKLFDVLDKAVARMRRDSRRLDLQCAEGLMRIPLADIRYLDVRRNYVTVHVDRDYKADAVVNIPFARPNRAASAREPFNSAIASPADCLVSAATAAPVLSRQRRSVSGATPGSPAT